MSVAPIKLKPSLDYGSVLVMHIRVAGSRVFGLG